MNKATIIALVVIGLSTLVLFNITPQNSYESEFQQFKKEYGKFYWESSHEAYRKSIFIKNLAKIEAHNSNKLNTYWLGINQFADLTKKQFAAIYLMVKAPKDKDVSNSRTMKTSPANDIDWSAKGMVSPIKDQGGCGSCWAFSATGAMESAYLIDGKTVLVSEQQLVDCSRAYGNQGCNGGWMDYAFAYIKDHGLVSQSDYPYVARDQSCKVDKGDFSISGYTDVDGCTNLLNALSQQPISVAVDAQNWYLYKGGVFSDCDQSIDHGVLLVGATDSYWKVKNSWSSSWGENGYIRLATGDTCAICSNPSFPVK